MPPTPPPKHSPAYEQPWKPLQLVQIYFNTATFDEISRDVKNTVETQISVIGGTMGLFTGLQLTENIELKTSLNQLGSNESLNFFNIQASQSWVGWKSSSFSSSFWLASSPATERRKVAQSFDRFYLLRSIVSSAAYLCCKTWMYHTMGTEPFAVVERDRAWK